MIFKNTVRNVGSAEIEHLLAKLGLRLKSRGFGRYAFSAIAVAGAAAVGWAMGLFSPSPTARKVQRRAKARLKVGRASPRKLTARAAH